MKQKPGTLPEDIRMFVVERFHSVTHLEVFLLVGNEYREWTPDEVSLRLRMNTKYAEGQLDALAKSGLIEQIEDRYVVVNDENIREMCGRLYDAYSTWRSSIINAIYEKPLEKIRDLADGFVFKKE